MKKLLIILSVLLMPYLCSGQDFDSREKFVFGAKVGGNGAYVYDQHGENFVADPKVGFAGGFFFGLPIWKYVGLQPEINFSQRGYVATGTILGNPYSDTRTSSFLDMPLQIQFKPQEFITFLGGVQYSRLLSQTDRYNVSNEEEEQSVRNDNIRKNMVSAIFGVDINIHHFIISGRTCWGLENNAGNGPSYMPRYKDFWVQLMVGFRLYR